MFYKFAVRNWKNDFSAPFWFYKEFPSAYLADRYAMRLTFKKQNSPYMVIFQAGEEFQERPRKPEK